MFGVCRSFREKTVCSTLWTSWKKIELKFSVFICFWWGIIWHVHISVKTFIQYISKSIIPTFTHYHQGKISSPRDNICWYTPWYRRIELAECISWYTLSINLVYRDKKENWKIISQGWTRKKLGKFKKEFLRTGILVELRFTECHIWSLQTACQTKTRPPSARETWK